MYAGVALTVVAIIVPYIDHAAANVLADHIRAGYPAYTQARIDTAVTTYLVYLSIIGALGVICWLWTIRPSTPGSGGPAGPRPRCSCSEQAPPCSVSSSKTRPATPACHHLLGWIGMLPCLAGFLAVTLLWMRS